jgi:predicted alpha/beta superfamily hydrolase
MVSVTLRSPKLSSWDVAYISGSHAALGEWQPNAIRLDWHDGAFRKKIDIPEGESFEYLFTCGSWRNAECDAERMEHHPHRATSQHQLHLDHVITNWGRDSVRYHVDVPSQHLPHPHTVTVHLPVGYEHQPERRYPVLYLHDGQNVFDAHTAFAGVAWEADETAERLQRLRQMTPIIQVGVANTPDRIREYAPHPGQADDLVHKHARFLMEEVKPFIDRTYRTKSEARFTGICGSSLGGLSSVYLTREYPEVFGRCAAMSPSLWWDDERYLQAALDTPKGLGQATMWIDIGSAEGFSEAGRKANVRRASKLANRLASFHPDRVRFVEVPDGLHNESAWAARYPDMLRFLYPTWL